MDSGAAVHGVKRGVLRRGVQVGPLRNRIGSHWHVHVTVSSTRACLLHQLGELGNTAWGFGVDGVEREATRTCYHDDPLGPDVGACLHADLSSITSVTSLTFFSTVTPIQSCVQPSICEQSLLNVKACFGV
jgi:hypothetical protein